MNKANDPSLLSWVDVSPDSDFPIQNLPYGIFRTSTRSPRAGVAIGSYILDLDVLQTSGLLSGMSLPEHIFAHRYLNNFMALGKSITNPVRERISTLLLDNNTELKEHADLKNRAIVKMKEAEMLMPIQVGDYTDFYSSIEHATNVGTMFRDTDNALLPNWKHLPVGYHGRSSSIVISGTPIHRPNGQTKAPDAEKPSFGPSKRVDFELEMAFITSKANPLGSSISTAQASDYIFGLVLFNDWSARDIQTWEYIPLGPFLAKNFASSISPWIVTLEALEPFRVDGPKQDPEVLPYLAFEGKCNFDINLEVGLQPEKGEENLICQSNFKYMYWNMNQQLAHHTVNGCNIRVGDMYGSGTISGPTPNSYGSMLELAWKGTKPIQLNDGTTRTFINDGDTVIMRGFCKNNSVRLGFGEVSGKIV